MTAVFLCNRKLRSYYTKTLRGDAHLAVRYIMPCIPLGRASVRQAHTLFLYQKDPGSAVSDVCILENGFGLCRDGIPIDFGARLVYDRENRSGMGGASQ